MIRPAGERCIRCALEAKESRSITSILLGLVDDHGAEILALRRQVNELRHLVLDLQRRHNHEAAE